MTRNRNTRRVNMLATAVVLLSCSLHLARAFTVARLPSKHHILGLSWTSKQQRLSSNRRRLQASRRHDDDDDGTVDDPSRRQAFLAAAVPTLSLLSTPLPALAALLQFPCPNLKNRYHFMRAGLSELEAEDLYASNALFLTNRENALVDSNEARKPIIEACRIMRDAGQLPTVAYHSLAANGMDTGDLVARTLLLARDRLLPEFTYLDPRGIGLWDGSSYSTTRKAVAAMDFQQAGPLGLGGRPPANNDGTPNETLADQFIRLRQFFSLQESRTSGENILVIFPDGVGPALSSALIAGLPLNTCHALEFNPGEIRLDITQQSVLALYETKKDDPEYLAMLEEGKEYWQALKQETKAGAGDFVSLKDRRAEEQRLQDEQAFVQAQQRKQKTDERERQEAMAKLRQQEEEARQERVRLKQQRREAEKAAEKERMRLLGEQREMAAQKNNAVVAGAANAADTSSPLDKLPLALALGATVGGMLLADNGGEATDAVAMAGKTATADRTDTDTGAKNGKTEPPSDSKEAADSVVTATAEGNTELPSTTTTTSSSSSSSQSPSPAKSSLYAQPVPTVNKQNMANSNDTVSSASSSTTSNVEEELQSLQNAQNRFMAGLASKASPATTVNDPVQKELDTLEKGQSTMNSYMSDFDDDWLRVLAEIRDEDDD